MARVAIIVVTYNSAAEIGACLDALTGIPDLEIIVVDNASSDRTIAEVQRRNAALIANSRNAGFAAAVNQGVLATAAPFVLLLNPDAQLQGGLDSLIARFDHPLTGAAGGMLTGHDGRPQIGFMARNLPTPAALIFEVLGVNRLWPGNPVNWHYRCLGNNGLTGFQVEQPAGAFLMFSRSAFGKVGGFDERFHPVWFEDVDFCAKLKAVGYKAFYTPQAVALHTGGHSVGTLPVEIREQYWYGSLLGYAAKYYRPLTFRTVCFAVLAGACGRAIAGITTHLVYTVPGAKMKSCRKILSIYGVVTQLALSRMFGR